MMLGSKHDIRSVSHFVLSRFSYISRSRLLTHHFALDVGRVIKSLTHLRASTRCVRTFDPYIT